MCLDGVALVLAKSGVGQPRLEELTCLSTPRIAGKLTLLCCTRLAGCDGVLQPPLNFGEVQAARAGGRVISQLARSRRSQLVLVLRADHITHQLRYLDALVKREVNPV